jgi:hypothetical protein
MVNQELLQSLSPQEAVEAKEWEDLFAQPAWKRLMSMLANDIVLFKEQAITATTWDAVCRCQGGRNVLEGVIGFESAVEARYAELQNQRTSATDALDTPDDAHV